jgi:hypothetical protein
MNLASAQRLAKKIKRSSKFNRQYKVIGVLTNRRGAHVQCVHKETGHPCHFGYEKTSPYNHVLTDEEITRMHS